MSSVSAADNDNNNTAIQLSLQNNNAYLPCPDLVYEEQLRQAARRSHTANQHTASWHLAGPFTVKNSHHLIYGMATLLCPSPPLVQRDESPTAEYSGAQANVINREQRLLVIGRVYGGLPVWF